MTSLWERIKTRRRLKKHLSLWFHPAYAYPCLERMARTRGILPDRGHQIVASLMRRGYIKDSDIHTPDPVSLNELREFHSDDYLESVNDPEQLASIFGADPSELEVDELLYGQRRAVGGTIGAIRSSLKHKDMVGLNLGGGFHHAEPESGHGFCVYNDVGVAIKNLRREKFQGKIAIVDLDYHQGNGNAVAFTEDPSVAIYSIHGSVWTHVTGGHQKNIYIEEEVGDDHYLSTLESTFPKFLQEEKPELIIFLAGTDVLRRDPLGSFNLSPEGVLARDRFVLDLAHDQRIPTTMVLAGGYGKEAVQTGVHTVMYLLGLGEKIKTRREDEIHQSFAEIAHHINPDQLQKEDSSDLRFTEGDILSTLKDHASPPKVLGYFTRYGVEWALERYGMLQKIRDLGFQNLKISVDVTDKERQMIRVHGQPKGQSGDSYHLLVEIVVHRETLNVSFSNAANSSRDFLSVEWLLMQNPLESFSLEHPQIPGQDHPGLGISLEVQELLLQVCHRLELEGVLSRPSFYHIAAGSYPRYHFLNPKLEGRFLALQEILKDHSLVDATQWIEEKKLSLADGSVVEWVGGDQVCPVNQELKDYFSSRDYQDRVLEEKHYFLQEGLHIQTSS